MQRYFAKEKHNDYFKLNDNDIYHITTVMRMKNNDLIEIVYEKKVYICYVDLKTFNFRIKEEKENHIKNHNIILVIPLLKEQKMDLILEKSTELGVSEIIPIITERSIIKLTNEQFQKKRERWTKICKEASEQSKRIDIPKIKDLTTIECLKSVDGVKLVCSTTEKDKNFKFFVQSLKSCDKIVLAVGPEGGFTNEEEERFIKCGFSKTTLGDRILRVETVPLFLLSILNYVYME